MTKVSLKNGLNSWLKARSAMGRFTWKCVMQLCVKGGARLTGERVSEFVSKGLKAFAERRKLTELGFTAEIVEAR